MALEFITKHHIYTQEVVLESKLRICDTIKAAAHVKLKRRNLNATSINVESKYTADAILPFTLKQSMIKKTEKIIVGNSNRETKALTFFKNIKLSLLNNSQLI